MAKIILEILSSSGHTRDLHVFDELPVRIGRGYGSDLILQDDRVSADHAMITVAPDGQIEIVDCQSDNGVFVVPAAVKPNERVTGLARIESGSTILIGHTKIRVFHPSHPVPAAKKSGTIEQTTKAPTTRRELWYALSGFVLIYFIHIAAHYPYMPMSVSQVIFFEILLILGIAIWTGIWAILGRLIRHQAHFGTHFTLECSFMVLMIPVINICGYLGFVFADPWVEFLLLSILGGAAFALVIYQHLTYATLLGHRVKLVSSVAVPLTLLLIVLAGGFAFRNEFSPEPRYYSRVKPPLLPPVHVYQPEEFISLSDKVFKELKADKDNKK